MKEVIVKTIQETDTHHQKYVEDVGEAIAIWEGHKCISFTLHQFERLIEIGEDMLRERSKRE